MKNALAYARVSTKEAGKELSIPAQLKAISECADSHGFRILEEFVVGSRRMLSLQKSLNLASRLSAFLILR